MTNRQPNAHGDGFTGQRHHSVTRGRVEVYVPEAHRFGETGSSFWQKLKRFDLRDDSLRVQHVERQDRDPFFAELRNVLQLARESGESPHALFFLHGFNVSFEEAAIRAAQIGFDLKVPGATAFFSWPSRGSVAAYPADEASIEASERVIIEFLIDFTTNCGAEKVHVIAHSMGTLRDVERDAAILHAVSLEDQIELPSNNLPCGDFVERPERDDAVDPIEQLRPHEFSHSFHEVLG